MRMHRFEGLQGRLLVRQLPLLFLLFFFIIVLHILQFCCERGLRSLPELCDELRDYLLLFFTFQYIVFSIAVGFGGWAQHIVLHGKPQSGRPGEEEGGRRRDAGGNEYSHYRVPRSQNAFGEEERITNAIC